MCEWCFFLFYSLSRALYRQILETLNGCCILWHQLLLKKIYIYEMSDNTYQWVASFLSQRTQQVLVEGQSSEIVPMVSGVPQDLVLGPVLVLIFANDLLNNLNSKAQTLADDCIVYCHIKSNQDHFILQDNMDTLAAWERKWGMDYHSQNCNTLRVSRAKSTMTFSYSPTDSKAQS